MYLRARLGLGLPSPQDPSIFRKSHGRKIFSRGTRDDGDAKARAASPGFLKSCCRNLALSTCATRAATRFPAASEEARRSRSLATEPQYILLDEPFAGIDPKAVDDIQNVILYLRNRSIGILVTDHNVRETLGVTDRAYIMADGRIFRSGVPRELTEDAEVRRLYLGEKFRM